MWPSTSRLRVSRASRTRCSSVRASSVSQSERMATNSSPPQRAATSERRSEPVKQRAAVCNTLSPVTCPCASLKSLKLSTSIMTREKTEFDCARVDDILLHAPVEPPVVQESGERVSLGQELGIVVTARVLQSQSYLRSDAPCERKPLFVFPKVIVAADEAKRTQGKPPGDQGYHGKPGAKGLRPRLDRRPLQLCRSGKQPPQFLPDRPGQAFTGDQTSAPPLWCAPKGRRFRSRRPRRPI